MVFKNSFSGMHIFAGLKYCMNISRAIVGILVAAQYSYIATILPYTCAAPRSPKSLRDITNMPNSNELTRLLLAEYTELKDRWQPQDNADRVKLVSDMVQKVIAEYPNKWLTELGHVTSELYDAYITNAELGAIRVRFEVDPLSFHATFRPKSEEWNCTSETPLVLGEYFQKSPSSHL